MAAPVESRLLRYSRGLLAFTAACLPLYAARFHYGPLPTTLLENLILLTVALYLVAKWRSEGLRFTRTPYDIAILLLLLAGAISVFVAKDHRAALGLYRAYFIEPVAIFYVAVDIFRRVADIRTLLLGFGIGTSIFALLNVIALGFAVIQHSVHLGAPPTAIYTSSNEVAMFLEPPFAMATALVLYSEPGRLRTWAAAWWLCVALGLALTFSRGSYGAVMVYAIVTIATARPRLRRILIIGTVAVVVLAAAAIVIASNTPLVETRFSFIAVRFSYVTRLAIYKDTLQVIAQHPLFGVGLGGFLFISHDFPLIYPHDFWLSLWVEIGLLGLLSFCFILFRLGIVSVRRFLIATGFEKALLWGVAGAVVLWTVHGFVDTPYFKNDMSTEFWIVAAIGTVAAAATRVSRPT